MPGRLAGLRRRGAGAFLLLCAACAGPAGPPSPVVTGGAPDIPRPDLAALEPAVREQLERGREDLERILAAPGLSDGDRAEAYGRAGMLYHAYNLLDAAEACYRNAELLTPQDYRWPYYLGRRFATEGQATEAARSLRRVLELRPRDIPALLHLARIEIEQNRLDEAEPLLLRVLELDARSVPALVELGRIESARRSFDRAVERFERGLELEPQATEINYLLGLAYRGLGDDARALEFLERRGNKRAGFSDPLTEQLQTLVGGWRILLNQGTAYARVGMHEQALAEFEKAAQAAPDQSTIYTNMGSTLTRMGQHSRALEAFERAIALDPRQATAHYNLGTLSARLGDDSRAVEHYAAALEIDPLSYQAHYNRANALRRVGRFEEAAGHYRIVVDADPANGPARLGEALSLVRLERWAEALDRLERGHRALLDDDGITQALVRMLAAAPEPSLRDGERALALARELLSRANSLPHVEAAAMAAAETGQFDLALEWQRGAVAALRKAGRDAGVAGLQVQLDAYRAGRPCRQPWRPDDPQISPRSRPPAAG